jgi:hypothetical protein
VDAFSTPNGISSKKMQASTLTDTKDLDRGQYEIVENSLDPELPWLHA